MRKKERKKERDTLRFVQNFTAVFKFFFLFVLFSIMNSVLTFHKIDAFDFLYIFSIYVCMFRLAQTSLSTVKR